jgi:hypothetical protein
VFPAALGFRQGKCTQNTYLDLAGFCQRIHLSIQVGSFPCGDPASKSHLEACVFSLSPAGCALSNIEVAVVNCSRLEDLDNLSKAILEMIGDQLSYHDVQQGIIRWMSLLVSDCRSFLIVGKHPKTQKEEIGSRVDTLQQFLGFH